MYLVDTNIIVSFFRENEDRYEDARKFLNTLETFVITDFILSEVATILIQKTDKGTMKKAMEFLQDNKNVFLIRSTKEELGETIELFLKQKRKISFVDISLMVLAKNHNLHLATFDSDLSKAAHELFPKK